MAAAAEVVTLADQALMQLAAEQGDAARASVIAEPVAGRASPRSKRSPKAYYKSVPSRPRSSA